MPNLFIFKAKDKYITAMGNGIPVLDNFDSDTKVLYRKYFGKNKVSIMGNDSLNIQNVTDFKYVYPTYANFLLTKTTLSQMSDPIKKITQDFEKTSPKTKKKKLSPPGIKKKTSPKTKKKKTISPKTKKSTKKTISPRDKKPVKKPAL